MATRRTFLAATAAAVTAAAIPASRDFVAGNRPVTGPAEGVPDATRYSRELRRYSIMAAVGQSVPRPED